MSPAALDSLDHGLVQYTGCIRYRSNVIILLVAGCAPVNVYKSPAFGERLCLFYTRTSWTTFGAAWERLKNQVQYTQAKEVLPLSSRRWDEIMTKNGFNTALAPRVQSSALHFETPNIASSPVTMLTCIGDTPREPVPLRTLLIVKRHLYYLRIAGKLDRLTRTCEDVLSLPKPLYDSQYILAHRKCMNRYYEQAGVRGTSGKGLDFGATDIYSRGQATI